MHVEEDFLGRRSGELKEEASAAAVGETREGSNGGSAVALFVEEWPLFAVELRSELKPAAASWLKIDGVVVEGGEGGPEARSIAL